MAKEELNSRPIVHLRKELVPPVLTKVLLQPATTAATYMAPHAYKLAHLPCVLTFCYHQAYLKSQMMFISINSK